MKQLIVILGFLAICSTLIAACNDPEPKIPPKDTYTHCDSVHYLIRWHEYYPEYNIDSLQTVYDHDCAH